MKIHFGIILVGVLVLASGCARKCPPCPSSAPVSYGSGTYAPASASFSSPSASYSGSTNQAASQYDSSSAYTYAKK